MGHDSFLWDMTDCYGTNHIFIRHASFVFYATKYRTPSRPPNNKSKEKKTKKQYTLTDKKHTQKYQKRGARSHMMSHSYAT